MSDWTRRDMLKASAASVGAVVAPSFASRLSTAGRDTIRVGVIGCGGRGTGAAWNALEADKSVRITAMADLFPDRLEASHTNLANEWADRVMVSPDHRFTGFDAYQRLLERSEVDYVVLATPPHFRPIHFQAAVNAGKHVFMEKPVAVDPAGVRRVIEAGRRADEQGLSVVAGTQRRHEANYLELMDRIASGEIGEVVSASCAWNQGGLWVHEREPHETDMEWQCRNWLYFCWLSGDHICEQHIHNLDVVNWAMGGTPVKAVGMGGRQVRTDRKYGNIFDHFAIEYEYEGGRRATSMCRQIDGCQTRVDERITGTRGSSVSWPAFAEIRGERPWKFSGNRPNPYMAEHENLIASIRGDSVRLNEARRVAESTLTAIMGRMSAYTGKEVTWEMALGSSLELAPDTYTFGALDVGDIPTPGRTPFV